MEAAKIIGNIIFALLQCVIYTVAECYPREFKMLPGGYNIYMQSGFQPVFKSVKLNDISQCGQLCAEKYVCNVWRYDGADCQIFHSMKDNVTAIKSSTLKTKTYYESVEDSQWIEIYSVASGSGINVFSTFLGNGDYKNSGIMTCLQTYCPKFFRSSLINAWNTLPISKVKLSLFKNNTEVLYMIFDGQGTNLENWFTMSRVLYSPWKDVYKGAAHVFFGIHFLSMRSFYAGKTHGGCPNDTGWLAISSRKWGCNWEKQPVYPNILYSGKDSATHWVTGDVLNVLWAFYFFIGFRLSVRTMNNTRAWWGITLIITA